METIQEAIKEARAIDAEVCDLDIKHHSLMFNAAKSFCHVKVGDVIVNDLDWCFAHKGKKIKVKDVRMRTSGEDFHWYVIADVLKADGSIGKYSVRGRITIDLDKD